MPLQINEELKERIRDILNPNETIRFAIREHRAGSEHFFAPATCFATDRRLIIMRRGILGLHQRYRIIKYDIILDVEFERGIMFSKVHFGLHSEAGSRQEKKWIAGLSRNDAIQFIDFVESMRPSIAKKE